MYIDDELMHVGTPHEGQTPHSGRYAYGSGKNPFQHSTTFSTRYSQLKAEGKSEKEILSEMNLTDNEFRAKRAFASQQRKGWEWWEVHDIKAKHPQMSNTAIAERLNITEGTVRNILKRQDAIKRDSIINTVNTLKEVVDKKGIVDVSRGVEKSTALNNISSTKLNNAIRILEDEYGYNRNAIEVRQVQDYKKSTKTLVLSKPDIDFWYINGHKEKIQPFDDYMPIDNGDSWLKMKYPTSVDRKRILVRYKEEGGADRDGTIELRRGVPDLDLVGKQYAQVRIAVDNKAYMKGMAYMSDDVPKGYDIVYNTNKKKGASDDDVFKPFKRNTDGSIDVDNPFGAVLDNSVGQRNYIDPKTGKEVLSPINIVKPEGVWRTYNKDLSSQFLAKQSTALIKSQINLAMEEKKTAYEDLLKIKNPAVRQKMLEDFGDNCDKAAYELKGAALPRQETKVLLPVPSLKNNEIYAPQYDDGEEVCLVRYPSAGLFEIPRLRVNNRNNEGKKVVTPAAIDAVGINPTVAAQLSGADFDGDTVLVLPTRTNKISNREPYQELLDFDTKEWKAPVVGKDEKGNDVYGCKLMTKESDRDKQMGIISNLITDMTLDGGYSDDEMIRADKYSMVVIDALKHKLDYKAAAKYYDIPALHKKYQGKASGGARTLISRAKGPAYVPEFENYKIDPKTGKRVKMPTGRKIRNRKTGDKDLAIEQIPKMSAVEDANDLLSDKEIKNDKTTGEYKVEKIPNKVPNPKEVIYATYANNLKSLANEARKQSVAVGRDITVNKDMAAKYSKEVQSIKDKLDEQKRYAPRERQAQRQASYVVRAKIVERYGSFEDAKEDKETLKKIKNQAIAAQRARWNSKRPNITLTEKEWEAVENNALNKTTVQDLMKSMDSDYLRSLAIPKSTKTIPASKKSRAKSMLARGYTIKEIADMLNISQSTIETIKGGN